MFFKEVNEENLGDTSIANIFIDIFMPMADGLYVKVYLLAYRNACNPDLNPNFSNKSIAKDLNIPLSDVILSWRFWESKGLVKMHKNDGLDDFDYSIEFLDVKKIYTENILINTKSIKSNADSIVATSNNPSIRKMFNDINQIIGRYLEPCEKISIMDIIDKYNMTTEMMVFAYEHTKDKTGSTKPVKYIEKVIRNWYDSKLYTPQDVKDSFAVRSERYILYRTIFNELGFSRQPSKAEKQIMDEWFDKYNIDIELILEACSKSKNISNPNISYINAIINNWNNQNIKTLNDLKNNEKEQKYRENIAKKSYSNKNDYDYKKTKFHNFNETFTQYTPEELDEIIERSQREKFK